MAGSCNLGYAQLVRDQVDACRFEAPGGGSKGIGAAQQGLLAEIESVGAIDPSRNQAFIGPRNGLAVIQFGFIEYLATTVIDEQALFIADPFYDQAHALASDLLASTELGTRNGCAVHGVLTQDACRCVQELHASPFDPDQGAQSELGFGIRDVTLTRNQGHQDSGMFGGARDYPRSASIHKHESSKSPIKFLCSSLNCRDHGVSKPSLKIGSPATGATNTPVPHSIRLSPTGCSAAMKATSPASLMSGAPLKIGQEVGLSMCWPILAWPRSVLTGSPLPTTRLSVCPSPT